MWEPRAGRSYGRNNVYALLSSLLSSLSVPGDITKAKSLKKYSKEEEKSCKSDFPNNFPGQRVELLSITLFHEEITASSSHLPNSLHLQFSSCLGTWGQTVVWFLLLHVTF